MSEEEVKAGPFYMPSFGFTIRIAKRILINFLPSSLKERVHCKMLWCTVLYFVEGLYKLAPYLLRMSQECSHTLYLFKQNLSYKSATKKQVNRIIIILFRLNVDVR